MGVQVEQREDVFSKDQVLGIIGAFEEHLARDFGASSGGCADFSGKIAKGFSEVSTYQDQSRYKTIIQQAFRLILYIYSSTLFCSFI